MEMSNEHSYGCRLLKTNLTPPLFIEMHVPRQESDRSYIGVLGVLLLPLSAILIFDFGVVPVVCYYLFILLFQFVSFVYLQMKHIW